MNRADPGQGGSRLPGWLDLDDGGRLFHWLHQPAAARDFAVILASPVGPEYMHCHRALRHLAERLAAAGIASLRFDPLGYGNSDGSPLDDALVERWRDTLPALAARLRAAGGYTRIGLVALRSAALLADRVLAAGDAIDSLVYWYPYSQGAAFLRDLETIDRLIDGAAGDAAYVNAGGYPLARDSAAALAAIRLADSEHRVRRALVVRGGERAGRPGKLQRQLAAAGVDCRELVSGALPRLARQAELSELPRDDIAAIVRWLDEGGAPARAAPPAWPRSERLVGAHFVESIVRHASPPLFGIHTEPGAAADCRRPLVVLGNIGAGHHVGPNRINVDLARRLAGVGLASLRFDLASLGDSPAAGADDNHPYPAGAIDDIDAMLAALDPAGERPCVLVGLCSGAYHAFHAQLRPGARPIVETLLINPLTFYRRAGESVTEPDAARDALRGNYYRAQARNWRTWLRLLGNPRKMLSIAAFVMTRAARALGRLAAPLAVRAGLAEAAPLARDIDALLARGRRLTFVVTAGDPGYQVIMGEAGRVIRGGVKRGLIRIERPAAGDHTFSTLTSRRELIDFIVHHLDSRYPAGQAGMRGGLLAE